MNYWDNTYWERIIRKQMIQCVLNREIFERAFLNLETHTSFISVINGSFYNWVKYIRDHTHKTQSEMLSHQHTPRKQLYHRGGGEGGSAKLAVNKWRKETQLHFVLIYKNSHTAFSQKEHVILHMSFGSWFGLAWN